MGLKNKRKNKNIKKVLILASLIGVSILAYKGTEYSSSKTGQVNKVVAVTKKLTTNNIKSQIASEEEKEKLNEDKPKVKTSNISSEGQEYAYDVEKVNAYDVEKVKNILDNKKTNDGKKVVFLTFDDGPSTTVTPKINYVIFKGLQRSRPLQ